MKLIKIIRNSGKTYRDDNLKIVYHISDKNLSHLSPISSLHGKSGLYVSESYRSIIEDWSGYVISKKNKNQSLLTIRKKIIDELNLIEDKINKIKKNNLEVPKELEDKINSLSEKRDKIDSQYKNSSDTPCYRTLYIHTIKIPQEIFNKSEQEFYNLYKIESAEGTANFEFWGWGNQVFISSEHLKYCKIIKVEKLDYGEWMDKIDRLQVGKQDLGNNMFKNKNKNSTYERYEL